MTWPTRAEEATGLVVNAFDDQLANHFHKCGMSARGRGAHHRDAEFTRDILRFEVEVVNDLHVVGHKTDRRDDDVLDAFSAEFAQLVVDVWS